MIESACFASPLVLVQDLKGRSTERCGLLLTKPAVRARRPGRRGALSELQLRPTMTMSMSMSAAATSSTTVAESKTGSTLICTSLTSATVAGQLEQMAKALSEGADMAEIRVDFLSAAELPNWRSILARKCLPVIVTNRAGWEGGNWEGEEHARLSILVEAEALGAEYIDVELAAFDEYKPLRTANTTTTTTTTSKLILSHHDFNGALSLDEFLGLKAKMTACGADVHKLAVMANTALDAVAVFEFLKSVNGDIPTIAIAMGEYGEVTRVACAKFSAYLTFACVDSGSKSKSAPGQISTRRLKEFFRFSKTGVDTKLYGIIGKPVGHSMSPAMHNAAMDAAGIDGLFVYTPVDENENVAEFIRKACAAGFDGFSVTIPHKQRALDAADEIDPIAKDIGAINTIVKSTTKDVDGKLQLHGYNTDWMAAIDAIERALPENNNDNINNNLRGKNVVCIGAGGAGRALAYGALARGAAKVVIVNRTGGRAEELAAEIGRGRAADVSGISMESFLSGSDENGYDVMINTTSVGMHPHEDETPVAARKLKLKLKLEKKALVFDAIYNPLETRLLREAKNMGCTTVSGLEMFVGQGGEQFRLWHGTAAPLEVMRGVVLDALSKNN